MITIVTQPETGIIVIKVSGSFKFDDDAEDALEVKSGSTFLAPANVWHYLIDSGDGNLIAQHVTQQPAGMEKEATDLGTVLFLVETKGN